MDKPESEKAVRGFSAGCLSINEAKTKITGLRLSYLPPQTTLGPTEISYLENRFCGMAIEANRYLVKNSNDPTPGNITEEKESELEEFIDYSKIIMGTLGHNVFEPVTDKLQIDSTDYGESGDHPMLFMKRKSRKSGNVIEATGKQTNEGFVVLRGSHIETIDSDAIPPKIKARRQKALIDSKGILQENMLFTSPSYAAAFVIGGHANGLTEWKTADGKTLKALEAEQ